MAATLPIDQARLSNDILDLVRQTSLNMLTSKYVRTQMEKKHGVNLGDFRKQIDVMIRNSIEKLEEEKSKPKVDAKPPMNGNASKVAPSNNRESSSPSPPPPSKSEPANSLGDLSFDDDNDKYTAIKRRRAQRTVNQRKPAATKAPRKTKEGGPKRNTAFTRICVLSDELSGILNRKYMRRSDVVKAMWAYFREHNLLDPKDKRYVLVDDRMRSVFGAKRVQAFGMLKILKNHIKDLDFLDEDTRRTAMREIEELEERGEIDLGGSSSTPGPSKTTVVESHSSDSSSESDSEPPPKKAAINSVPQKATPSNNNSKINDSPSTSKTEEPRPGKLVLKISKKNDRVVSVKVNDDEETNGRTNDNGLNNDNNVDMDKPPKLEREVQNDAASSSSQDSSSDSSSNSSSGSSSSSSAASSPEHNGSAANNVKNKNLSNDLRLSESDSDA